MTTFDQIEQCNNFLKYIEKLQSTSGIDKDLVKALAIVWAGAYN